MPKSYSNSEREYIISKLKTEAESCLTQFGVKKTSVDELVKRVSIPKGTFYLFYRSKELLFYDVFLEKHKEIQTQLINMITTFGEKISAEQFSTIIFQLYKHVDQSFLLNLMTNGDIELIMRKLPDDIVVAHHGEDEFNIASLLSLIPQAKNKDAELFSGAFRAVFMTMLHKREIGEAGFDSYLKLLIDGLSIQLFKEKKA